MAFARDTYSATGGQTDFTISFPYVEQADVTVYQAGVLLTPTTDYTFFNSTTIRLVSGATALDVVLLIRATSQSVRSVDFTAGTLTEADLDGSAIQMFYMAQEALDKANVTLGLGADGQWDAQNLIIRDMADPVEAQDAATLNYVNNLYITGGSPTITDPEAFRVLVEVDRPVQTKTTDYTMVATDVNNVIQWTSAGTYDLLASGTVGSDFYVDVFANGGAVTIDPNGSETINGAATIVVADTESATLVSTGTGWLLLKGGAGGGNWKGGAAEKGAANSADIFRVHSQTLNVSTTLDGDENASCTGPLTVASGITLTLSSGNRLVIV